MEAIKDLNKFLKKYKLSVGLGVFFLTCANFFLVWIPVLIRRTIDEVEKLSQGGHQLPQSLIETLFVSESGKILGINSMILLGAVILYGFFLFLTRQTLIVSSRKVEYDMRNTIIKKLMHLPSAFYSKYSHGEVYIRASEDVNKVREYYGPVIMYSINTVTRAGFVITMMYLVNKELMLWAMLPLPLLSVFAYWITGYIHKQSIIIQEQYSRLASQAKESFSNIRLIKAYNRINNEQEKFEILSEGYRRKKLKLDMIESFFHPGLNFLIGISLIIVIWQGGNMIIQGSLTVGNIVEFMIYVAYLIWPVAALGYTTNRFQKSLASWYRVKEVLDYPIEIHKKIKNKYISLGDIEFKNVWFKYPDTDEYIIKNLSLKIKAGSKTAIVGRTGSGKTTLIQLIPRLFDATKGRILIDGTDIKEIKVKDLRNSIGFVPQGTFLFSDTIGQNISFGIENATKQHIEKAAELAMVKENILQFKNKFKTILGERGITLSGGQKQRTAIARALIKSPKILIFDDSLSAIDTKTENSILKNLKKELGNITTITISHRISTIKNADTILYLENGQIIEEGTHEELVELNGHYNAIYKKQILEQELEQI